MSKGENSQDKLQGIIQLMHDDLHRIKNVIVDQYTLVSNKHYGVNIDLEDFQIAKKALLNSDPDSEKNKNNAVVSLLSTEKEIEKRINKLINKGTDSNEFNEIRHEILLFRQNLENELSSNNDIENLVSQRQSEIMIRNICATQFDSQTLHGLEEDNGYNKLASALNLPLEYTNFAAADPGFKKNLELAIKNNLLDQFATSTGKKQFSLEKIGDSEALENFKNATLNDAPAITEERIAEYNSKKEVFSLAGEILEGIKGNLTYDLHTLKESGLLRSVSGHLTNLSHNHSLEYIQNNREEITKQSIEHGLIQTYAYSISTKSIEKLSPKSDRKISIRVRSKLINEIASNFTTFNSDYLNNNQDALIEFSVGHLSKNLSFDKNNKYYIKDKHLENFAQKITKKDFVQFKSKRNVSNLYEAMRNLTKGTESLEQFVDRGKEEIVKFLEEQKLTQDVDRKVLTEEVGDSLEKFYKEYDRRHPKTFGAKFLNVFKRMAEGLGLKNNSAKQQIKQVITQLNHQVKKEIITDNPQILASLKKNQRGGVTDKVIRKEPNQGVRR